MVELEAKFDSPQGTTDETKVTRWQGPQWASLGLQDDTLAVEEPLEIRLNFELNGQRREKTVSITMRTPGHDAELAIGFLFTEGVIQEPEKIQSIESERDVRTGFIRVRLGADQNFNLKTLDRHFYTSSSCGVCGKSSIEAATTQSRFLNSPVNDTLNFKAALVPELLNRLREAQAVFDRTGGLHASALFHSAGELLVVREDVGRHNALDKVLGWSVLQNRLPLSNVILVLSGRISFELVQKAAMAGLRAIVAVGAPSSLALEMARKNDITLIGFVREGRFNLYSGDRRVQ